MARRTVAVVGGGCSGVLVARELVRAGDDRVVLVEPGEPGGGVAYGAARPWHLLNSRAGAMSADPDDPGHFARWAGAAPEEFVGRRRYGDYLRSVLAPLPVDLVPARATGVTPDGVVTLDRGAPIRADRVVLATGGPAGARHPLAVDHPAYLADPWRPGAVEAIPGDVPVLLIGAGLTAVDVALTLTADGTRSAPVTAVSRRGQLPLSHTVAAAPPAAPALTDCATLRDVVRAVRESAGHADDWRAVVDGLRPYLDELWVALTPAEQDAFLRHLARPWECHRHRMAPAVAATVARLRADGLLRIRSGGVRSLTVADGRSAGLRSSVIADGRSGGVGSSAVADGRSGGVGSSAIAGGWSGGMGSSAVADGWSGGVGSSAVAGGWSGGEVRPVAGGGLVADVGDGPQWFGAVVDCAGPGRLPGAAGTFVGDLLATGQARVGPHGLGLDIDARGRLLTSLGGVQERLWLVGPLRRGARWETTAVPEIRAQARRLAADLGGAQALLEAA